jgi:hypothetical protein
VTCIRLRSYAFGSSTSTKTQGAYVEYRKRPRGRSGSKAGRSAVVVRTVRACAESFRVPSFSRDLLSKTAGLARETTCSGSRPPLYIDEGLPPIEPPTIDQIKSISRFTYALQ